MTCHPDEPMACSTHPDTRPNLSCFLLFVEIGLVSPAGLELLEVRHQLAYLLFFKIYFIYLFIYWLCWVFVSVRGLSLVAASGDHSSSRCAGLSLSQPLLLRSTGSRCSGSVVVAHGPSCSAACGIFPDQGSNPCPLHWQTDSQPLRHQGSPHTYFFCLFCFVFFAYLLESHLSSHQAQLWAHGRCLVITCCD